jgi:WD40 repeat protein
MFRMDFAALMKVEIMTCRWDLTTGRLKAAHSRALGSGFYNAALSPDGSLLAAPGLGERIILMDMETGKEQVLPGVRALPLGPIAYSPDGRMLAFTSDPVTVRIWDVAAARETMILMGHERRIQCLAFSADGKTLAVGGEDQTVRIWDITQSTGPTVLLPTELLAAPVRGNFEAEAAALVGLAAPVFALTPSGERLVTARGSRVQVWDVATGREGSTLKDFVGPPFPPDRTQDSIGGIALSRDGTLVAAFSSSEVKVWDLVTRELRAQIPPDPRDFSLFAFCGFTADGRSLMAGGRFWDTATWQQRSEPAPAALEGLKAISPDGTALITAKLQTDQSGDGAFQVGKSHSVLTVRDAGSGAPRYTVEFPEKLVQSARLTPDGRSLAVGLVGGPTVLVDFSTGKELAVIPGAHLAFSADGRLAATADAEGTIRLWAMDTLAEHATLQGHTATVVGVAFSPDGRTVASSCADGSVKLWDPLTGQERLTFRHEGRMPHQIAFTPDGETLVVAWSGHQDPPTAGVVTLYRAPRLPAK